MTGPTFVRKLTFRSENLAVDADLILTFDSGKVPGIYKDYYPTAWKVSTFKKGQSFLRVTYNSSLAFTKTFEFGSVFRPIVTRQEKTKLIKDGDAYYSFTQPVPAEETACENGVPASEDIGLGFIKNPGDSADTVQVWPDVPSGAEIIPEFNPTLRGYVATGYKEGEVIKGQIQAPVLFEENLAKLKEDTTWILEYDEGSGKFSIRQD